ncbi:GNAT family N-acetyltransferase [Chloroflexota bacterium]
MPVEGKMISGSKITLRDKRLSDARNDYTWHSDSELSHLDAIPLPKITFQEYLAEYSFQLRYPFSSRKQFAIDTKEGKHIGNCMYYDINDVKSEAELGIMIGDKGYWDKSYGSEVITTLIHHIFETTNLKRIYLKTLDSNIRAQKSFRKCGFTPYGHMDKNGFSFLLMETHRSNWEKNNAFITEDNGGGEVNNKSSN